MRSLPDGPGCRPADENCRIAGRALAENGLLRLLLVVSPETPAAAEPLAAAERARGRRLAIASHPFGMTHRIVMSEHLPTLALVALGASEGLVGLQRTCVHLAVLLQLPALALVGRVRKRSILLAGQLLAIVGGAPLLAFGWLASRGGDEAQQLALASFAVAAAGFSVSETVWFAMLHGFQEPARIGRFFAWLRTGWHVALIAYFLAAQHWLSAHPGGFAPLFAVGFTAGVVRAALIARLPERREGGGDAPRVRQALALVLREPMLRRYLAGIALGGAVRGVAFTFALVMLRRVIGFEEGRLLYTTAALYAGGLATLWLWGRVVDAVGPWPVFRWTSLGQALLVLGLVALRDPSAGDLTLAVALFFGIYALGAGFDVADTHTLFALAPAESPATTLVGVRVVELLIRAAIPLVAGVALEAALAADFEPLAVYRVLFVVCAAASALASRPLRAFAQRAG
jgi:hypothetical protein